MSEPYLGQINLFPFDFAPRGWAKCDGQLLPINENQALYSLLGTMYGGNGQTNFALPDLRGRVPIHRSASGFPIAWFGGEETHALTIAEMPAHSHLIQAYPDNAAQQVPGEDALLATASMPVYANPSASPSSQNYLNPKSITETGGGQPHENIQPCLALNFCIALQGFYPPRN